MFFIDKIVQNPDCLSKLIHHSNFLIFEKVDMIERFKTKTLYTKVNNIIHKVNN